MADFNLCFTLLSVFFISLLILFLSRRSNSKRLNLPPGPPGWPLVGNLFHAARSGKPFFQYVDDIRRVYGPIFTLKMGTRTMIVVSDAKLCHEALIQKGAIFASRPLETPTRNIFSYNKFTVNAAMYGPVWRSLRRNMVQNMLSSSRLKEFRGVRERAMDKLIDRVKKEAESNNGVVWVLKNARFAMFWILVEMSLGMTMDEESVERMDEMMKTVLITADFRIHDYLPILRPLLYKLRKRAVAVRQQQIDLLAPFIEKRREMVRNGESNGTAAMSFSYLDTLFDLKVEGRKTAPCIPELVTLCSEFLNGGTDTTATAVEWGIVQLITNPEIQSKLFDEIHATVGNRKVDESDVEKLGYLQAVVKELLRKHPPTAFTLTHAVTEPAKLGGYDIPVGANVDFFLKGFAQDPKLWSDPDKFDPDRFWSGREDADVTGVTGVRMLPFGAGRRICPGLGMATVHLHLMLARMVQEFEWSAYPPDTPLDFTAKVEFTVVMKNPLRALANPRRA